MKSLQLILLAFCILVAQERVALIIGADKGLKSDRQLRFAVTDAKKMDEVLQELCGFHGSRCYFLADPTIRQIEKTVDELKGRIKEVQESGRQVEFFIYYSGHGSVDALHIDGNILSHKQLLSIVDTLKADLTIAIVDACYSGALVTEKGISIAQPLALKLTDTLSAQGTILLTSSSSDQTSHESADIGGSVFTHYILSALRGAADYDRNAVVTLSEAYCYARMQTTKTTGFNPGAIQQPSYAWNIKGKEEIGLSRLDRAEAFLYLEHGESSPHFIIDEQSQSVIAQFTPDDKPVVIALPPRRYRIQRISKNEIAYKEVDCSWKKACTLSLASMKIATPAVFSRKGPLDRPSLCQSVNGGVLLLSTFPSHGAMYTAPTLSYQFHSGFYQTGINIAFGKNRFEGTSMVVNQTIWHIGAVAGKSVYMSKIMALFAGVEAGAQLVNQQLVRKDETRLREIGFAPLSDQKTAVAFSGVSVTITPFIYGKIPLHCTIGFHDYIAKMSTGYKQYPRPYAGVSTGYTFSK